MVNTRAFALDMAQPGAVSLDQDWHAVSEAVSNLSVHAAAALQLGVSVTGILQWLAVISAMYVTSVWWSEFVLFVSVPFRHYLESCFRKCVGPFPWPCFPWSQNAGRMS